MRFRLCTLLILVAVMPPVLAAVLGAAVDDALETIERRSEFFIAAWIALIVTMIFVDWQYNRGHFRRN